MPIGTYDRTPPLAPIAMGGVDVAAGVATQVIAATSGRVKVEIYHAGTAGRVWLGFDQTAQAGVGVWLDPGQGYTEFFAGSVRVRNTGADPVRVTWVEWGA